LPSSVTSFAVVSNIRSDLPGREVSGVQLVLDSKVAVATGTSTSKGIDWR
jgi:hypothetical protein